MATKVSTVGTQSVNPNNDGFPFPCCLKKMRLRIDVGGLNRLSLALPKGAGRPVFPRFRLM